MSECKMISITYHPGPTYFGGGQTAARTTCLTHGIEVQGAAQVVPPLCAVGRIEKAVEDGIARIEAALKPPTGGAGA